MINIWQFIAGIVASGVISMVSVVIGASIATAAYNGKKYDETERDRYAKWVDNIDSTKEF